jgi:hypothetical protein
MTNAAPDRDDIAWMRQLAEEGGRTPMRGASILLAAGLIFGLASLAHWAVLSELTPWDAEAFNLVWGLATVLFLIVLTAVNLTLRKAEGVTTIANRATGVAWMSVGLGIFALMTSIVVLAVRAGGEAGLIALSLIPSVIMVFYGLGWSVTAAMQRSRPLGLLAGASLIAAPAVAALTGQAEQYLAYGAALFLLMALPGALLMRQAGRV